MIPDGDKNINAYERGKSEGKGWFIYENPYPEDSSEHEWWERGYEIGCEEFNERIHDKYRKGTYKY